MAAAARTYPLSRAQFALLQSLYRVSELRSGRVPLEIAAALAEFFLMANPTNVLRELRNNRFLEMDDDHSYAVIAELDDRQINHNSVPAKTLPRGEDSLRYLLKHYDAGVRSFIFLHFENPPDHAGGTGSGEGASTTETDPILIQTCANLCRAATDCGDLMPNRLANIIVAASSPNGAAGEFAIRAALTQKRYWLSESGVFATGTCQCFRLTMAGRAVAELGEPNLNDGVLARVRELKPRPVSERKPLVNVAVRREAVTGTSQRATPATSRPPPVRPPVAPTRVVAPAVISSPSAAKLIPPVDPPPPPPVAVSIPEAASPPPTAPAAVDEPEAASVLANEPTPPNDPEPILDAAPPVTVAFALPHPACAFSIDDLPNDREALKQHLRPAALELVADLLNEVVGFLRAQA